MQTLSVIFTQSEQTLMAQTVGYSKQFRANRGFSLRVYQASEWNTDHLVEFETVLYSGRNVEEIFPVSVYIMWSETK